MSSDATHTHDDDQEDEQINTADLVLTFTAVQALVRMLEVVPSFREHWEEVKWVASTTYPIRTGAMFTEFALHVVPRIEQGQTDGMEQVFAFIEEAMLNEQDDWSNAAATGFLEMVSNLVPSKLAPEVVIPPMGLESRKHCRVWAEWCGADAATLALWDTEY